MADSDDKQLSEGERRRRWNTSVMAGSVAPTAASWAMPKAGWRQLREMTPKAVVAMGLAWLVTALLIIAVLLGYGRLAAYAVLALLALYLCGSVIYLAARRIARQRQ